MGQVTKKCFIIIVIFNPVPNVDLPPLCSSRFRPGPPNEQAQVLSQFVANVLSK